MLSGTRSTSRLNNISSRLGATCRIDTSWIVGQDSQLSSAGDIYKIILVEERAPPLG
jgi:hypothetical protein